MTYKCPKCGTEIEAREKRTTALEPARTAHYKKYNMIRYGDETRRGNAYFTGWSNISNLVRMAFGEKNVARIVDKEKASAMAMELSDIFLKYVWFNDENIDEYIDSHYGNIATLKQEIKNE